ncbi:MAG: hypothetical protein JXB15_11955 [Anaerolineales bacterium]|nr:hypothetical protein [Anaerolineales bacterium]
MGRVECRSDYDFAGRPTAIYWQERRLEVTACTASWRTPEGKCFRVSVQTGQGFELCYDEITHNWQINPC